MRIAPQIARRALVLAALVCRGDIERGAGQPEAEAIYARLYEWLDHVDLWSEVEASEVKLLKAPMGSLERHEVIRATWYVEGLAILAWAMKLMEFPIHDEKVDPNEVAETVGFLDEGAMERMRAVELRLAEELEACREFVYALHCRLRDFLRNGGRKDFTRWVEPEWLERLGLDVGRLIVDRDLANSDKPIFEAEMDQVRECESITYERHRAIIWLVEEDEIYSLTPVDT